MKSLNQLLLDLGYNQDDANEAILDVLGSVLDQYPLIKLKAELIKLNRSVVESDTYKID